MINQLDAIFQQLKQIKPVVLCLTNYVTMDFMANSLLALGAAPIMSCDLREIEELVKISHAININMGTLNVEFIALCKTAIQFAREYSKPIVLDPVGAGASLIRTQSARELMVFADIIRGNASEVLSISADEHRTLGVESMHQVSSAKTSAGRLAANYQCTVVVSGKEDFITDGNREISLGYGSSLMPLVTGMGCALTAVIAAFRGVLPHSFDAAVAATTYFGLCGNLAAEKANQPGAFRTAFIDELCATNLTAIEKIYVKLK